MLLLPVPTLPIGVSWKVGVDFCTPFEYFEQEGNFDELAQAKARKCPSRCAFQFQFTRDARGRITYSVNIQIRCDLAYTAKNIFKSLCTMNMIVKELDLGLMSHSTLHDWVTMGSSVSLVTQLLLGCTIDASGQRDIVFWNFMRFIESSLLDVFFF